MLLLLITVLLPQEPKLTPMPLGRYECASLVHGREVFLIGGTTNKHDYEPQVDIFNVDRNTWRVGKPLPTPRTFLCGAELEGKLYVIGGSANPHRSTVVERYDPVADRWERVADLQQARTHVAAVALDGKIYVIGGFLGLEENKRTGSATVEVYDPRNNRWTPGPSLPVGLHGHAAVVLAGKIHVMGDGDYHFKLEGGEWKPCAKLPEGNLFAEAAVVKNKLYLIGGAGGDFKQTWEYDPRTDRWTRRKDSPTHRYHFNVAVVGERIYVFGGVKVMENVKQFQVNKVDCYDPVKDQWRE